MFFSNVECPETDTTPDSSEDRRDNRIRSSDRQYIHVQGICALVYDGPCLRCLRESKALEIPLDEMVVTVNYADPGAPVVDITSLTKVAEHIKGSKRMAASAYVTNLIDRARTTHGHYTIIQNIVFDAQSEEINNFSFLPGVWEEFKGVNWAAMDRSATMKWLMLSNMFKNLSIKYALE